VSGVAEGKGRIVVTGAIHRIVEQQAASRPQRPAVIDGRRVLTYRELNQRANACARTLIAGGFRRGGHAVARLDAGADLAVALLGILKAGGSYTWIESHRESAHPLGISIAPGPRTPDQYVAVDIPLPATGATPSPNLPVLARGSDIACILYSHDGAAEVMVPHAAIVGLPTNTVPALSRWGSDSGALDLWLALMSGATAATGAVEETISAAA
jgi:non-ribosomal peptide synthetase component F